MGKRFSVKAKLCFTLPCTLIFFSIAVFFSCTTEIRSDILSPEERAWLTKHNHKIIIDRSSENWAPIEGVYENGTPFGISIDYYKLIEQKLGFQFKVDEPRTWSDRLERYKNHKIDVVNNLQKNPERTEYLLFTKPFIEIHNVIIVRKEIKKTLTLDQMRGMVISVTKGYAIYDYIKSSYGFLNILPVENDLTALQQVALNTSDATVMNAAVASYLIDKYHITNLRIAGNSGFMNALCLASRKDWPILNTILDKGLSLITPEERKRIRERWIHLEWTPFYKNTTLQLIGLFVIIIFIVSFFWNARLRKEITERKEAEKELRKSERQYRLLFEKNIAVMLLIDPDTGVIYDANQSACSYYGFPKNKLINMKISEINILTKDEVIGEIEKAKKTERNYFNFRHRLSDGTVREVEVFSGPITISKKQLLCSIIHDISERKSAEAEREKLIEKLQKALEEIKTLRGIVPICSKCKKIRDDKGYWNLIETYIETHSEASFSHSMCPECSDELYGEEDWYIEMKEMNDEK